MTVDISFKKVETHKHLKSIMQLANIIWTEHYTPIIGSDQVEYMLSEFHSYDAIKEELKNKEVHYYMIRNGGELVGYAGRR